MSLHFSLITRPADFMALRPQWQALAARQAELSPFQDHDWVRLVWRHRRYRRPMVATVHEDGELVLAVPLMVRYRRLRKNLDSLNGKLPQHLSALVAPDGDAPMWFDALRAGLRRTTRAEAMWLFSLPAAGRIGTLFQTEQHAFDVPEIALQDGFDGWFDGFGRKTRSQHRRMLRLMGGATLRLSTPDSWADDLGFFFAHKRRWRPRVGQLRDWVREPVYERELQALGPGWLTQGRLLMGMLDTPTGPAAAVIMLLAGPAATLYAITYDPAYAAHSPGTVAIVETVRAVAARGVVTLDLMRSVNDWKARLKTADARYADIRLPL